MTLKKIILPFAILLCQFAVAQQDSIVLLREVIISDTQLQDFSASQSVLRLNDSIIGKSSHSLTSLLMYNSVIFFKENGLGMVSSPSFRGTTAQQTAVIWNGININSQLNGQTDFNLINTRDFNAIAVRAGGGSVIYGSSAIGGSIHLNNETEFGSYFRNNMRADYGSYNTLAINYNLQASDERAAAAVSISRNSSDNDYEYPGWHIKNENGQYYNTSANTTFAYRVNDRNTLRLYSYIFDGERHFSRTLAAPSRSKYRDTNTRNLLEWVGLYKRFTSKVKAAYLTEDYKYFENHATDVYSYGKVNTFIGRYDLSYAISDAVQLNAIADYTSNTGEGSDIEKQKRHIGSGSLLMSHNVTKKFGYEAGIRKEISSAYKSPLLFSLGTYYTISSFYRIKINASRNFRMPTFNDLYWQGSGNPDLKPESSYQAELGNNFSFKGFNLSVTGYYIKLRNMLRWVPGSDVWRPENVGRVNTYGLEGILNWQKSFGKNRIEINGTYAYTVSQEDGSKDQLIYVPFHKATASFAYAYQNLTAYYRHFFNGEVYITSDNSASLDPYNVSTVGAEYRLEVLEGIDVGLLVHNLWNQEYQNVSMRPMPGRNYNMYLNFKF